MLRSALATTLFVAAPLLAAQDEAGVTDPRLGRLVTLDSYHPFTPPDAATWGDRRDALRRQVLLAAGLVGGIPTTKLAPVVHGAIERDGYTVEKVFFSSLPGFYVTGNLYRPSAPGPHPGVLSPHGHWANGRFSEISDADARTQMERGEEVHLPNAKYHLQARCAHLARMGCVVFHYDMIGYGDSTQIDHRVGFGDLEAELWGFSHFGLQTLNSIRALDFLTSLPDVDPERIGVTGASGGGTQTFILGAVDDRPDVLFPAVMVSTAMQGGCVCENASHLRVGTGNVELAALVAPKPLGLTGANDWTKEIETKGLPELERLYTELGAPEHVSAVCHPDFPHNYNAISRAEMYAWFHRHLGLAGDAPLEEGVLDPVAPHDLSVFDEKHPRPEDAANLARLRRTLHDRVLRGRRRLEWLAERRPDEYRHIVRGALSSLVQADGLPVISSHERTTPEDPVFQPVVESVHYESYDGGKAIARMWRFGLEASKVTPVLVVASEATTFETLAQVSASQGAGYTVAVLFPLLVDAAGRSLGALPVDEGRHGTYVGYTHGYNTTLFAERTRDVLAAIAHLRAQTEHRVRVVGVGPASAWVASAVALAPEAVERVAIEGIWDFDQVERLDDRNLLPRAMTIGGFDGIAALLAPTELMWMAELNVPKVVRDLYSAAGAEGALSVMTVREREALKDWLTADLE